jgi:RND superfamily putative drug exporter
MKLLGDWNWYLPSWLEWLPHIGGEGEPPAPPREPPAPETTKEPEPRPA